MQNIELSTKSLVFSEFGDISLCYEEFIWLFENLAFFGGGGGVEEDGGREDGLKYNEVCLFKI